MKNNMIIQYVGFITNLEPGEFIPKWESHAKKLLNNQAVPLLQQQIGTAKSRFRYISQHEWHDSSNYFSFMKGRLSEHFPEHNAKVIQAGGYQSVEKVRRQRKKDTDVKLVVCLHHGETDMDFYKGLSLYSHLHIYEAYYESCMYSFILEFFVSAEDAEYLEQQIKQRSNAETGIYRECVLSVKNGIEV
jgi:hypothetical protein